MSVQEYLMQAEQNACKNALSKTLVPKATKQIIREKLHLATDPIAFRNSISCKDVKHLERTVFEVEIPAQGVFIINKELVYNMASRNLRSV